MGSSAPPNSKHVLFLLVERFKKKEAAKKLKELRACALIPALVRLKQAGLEFKESVGFLVKPFLNESDGLCVFI